METEITAALVAKMISSPDEHTAYYTQLTGARRQLVAQYGEEYLNTKLNELRRNPEHFVKDMPLLDAIIRWQLVREGVFIWCGDASSCVAQLLHAAILKIPSDVHEGK